MALYWAIRTTPSNNQERNLTNPTVKQLNEAKKMAAEEY